MTVTPDFTQPTWTATSLMQNRIEDDIEVLQIGQTLAVDFIEYS